jgi:hypothetical protein
MTDKIPQSGDQEAAMQRARVVKANYEAVLMRKANVVGVGVGMARRGSIFTGEVGLVVLVRRKVPHSLLSQDDLIPRVLDGVPVDVQEVGDIRAMAH